uniref:GRIP1 associated protein 1 n=1 Tax=Homo sapiens TaxID=9606 RepID=A0A994J790_HUMAN
MAQALSEEEFQRMQAQLLELRTNNYQLSDELRKNGVELTSLRQKVAYLDKEFSKAQKPCRNAMGKKPGSSQLSVRARGIPQGAWPPPSWPPCRWQRWS